MSELLDEEVSLIRAMVDHGLVGSFQEAHSYFSYPDRDFNPRVISEIMNKGRHPDADPASPVEARLFMSAMQKVARPDPANFLVGDAHLRLTWWPMGQGLFATGSLHRKSGGPVHWSYDCGSASGSAQIDRAIQNFGSELKAGGGTAQLAFAVLSHFDADHINGFIRLIKSVPIQTLLLPYIPPWQRLVIAIEQGLSAADPLFGFFINPVAFLSQIEGGQFGEVIFVGGRRPGGEDEGFADPVVPEDRGGPLKAETEQAPRETKGDPAARQGKRVGVRFLRWGGRLLVPGLWEFVPYNDIGMAHKVTADFKAAVEPLVKSLLTSELQSDLDAVRKVYDRHFGKTARKRNLISLFLYSGPLGQSLLWRRSISCSADFRGIISRFAQMHTGDATLDRRRFREFASFYRPHGRLERSGVFQVMHHGAAGNWHEGIGADLSPAVSIFSSDPAHRKYKHPHAEVLRDFWPYGPVQVDKDFGFRLDASLLFFR